MPKLYILNKNNEVQFVATIQEAYDLGVFGFYVIYQNKCILYDFWNQGFYKPANNLKEVIGHLEWMEEAEEIAYQEWLLDYEPDKCGFTRQKFDNFIMRPATYRLQKVLMYNNGRTRLLERPCCLNSQGKVDLDIAALRRRHMLTSNAVKMMGTLKEEGYEAALIMLRQLEGVTDNEGLAKKLDIDINVISRIQHHGEFRNFCEIQYPFVYDAYMKHYFDNAEL